MKYHYFVSAAVSTFGNTDNKIVNYEYITNEKINSMDQISKMAKSIHAIHDSMYTQTDVAIINYILLRQEQE